MSLSDIEQLFTSPPEEEASRTDALRQAEATASHLCESSVDSADLQLLAQKAGDAARDEQWRTPLGVSGLLAFFCRLINADGLPSQLAIHTLRVIGNSCADKDENRERVVSSGCLPKIVARLDDDSLLAIAIPVLFNICVDYEPAQKALYEAGINPALVKIISGPQLENASSVTSIICRLLILVAPQEPEEGLVDPATPFALLSLAMNTKFPVDLEDFLGLTSVALTYLFKPQFQKTFLQAPNAINLAFRAFARVCGEGGDDLDTSGADADDQEELKQVQLAFIQTFAELSGNDLFAPLCPLDGPEARTLRAWISTPKPPLQSAACLVLGNIARADDICTSLVQDMRVHEPLVALLRDPSHDTDPQLLHSVLGFLKNLAIPAANKPVLAAAGLLGDGPRAALPRIWAFDVQPQIQFDAASLARMLLVHCPETVRLICAPPATSDEESKSALQLLMDLHARSDQEPTKMETARAAAMVCRVLHAGSISSDDAASKPTALPPLEGLYEAHHPTLTNALVYLGMQDKFPALRSEFLFVFALMARSPEGAGVVARSLRQDARLVGVLVKAVTGREFQEEGDEGDKNGGEEPDTSVGATASFGLEGLSLEGPRAPEQAANASRTASDSSAPNPDRENGLVLIAELLARCPTELSPSLRTTFTSIFQVEGRRVSK
ncbi:armadillo-type protein [Biscogniauxia mediterranea]|nr:armadillo-type protein [Biscogniauxia mediterranea]